MAGAITHIISSYVRRVLTFMTAILAQAIAKMALFFKTHPLPPSAYDTDILIAHSF